MFGVLTEKFQKLISGLKGKLTEENLAKAAEEARLALLEADVNYSVAGNFVKKVKERAIGSNLIKGVKPVEQFFKIIHDELVSLMGKDEPECKSKGTIMVCGLQGSGKTTICAKLANFFIKKNKKVLLAACDRQRPAAIDQLEQLGGKINCPVFTMRGESSALKVAKGAREKAQKEGFDLLIIDTAGRLHVDSELMNELKEIKKELEPSEILFVANATIGQEAVKVAQEFNKSVEITGSILTMLDGNARAGAAISIREVTGKPLKFEGVGEKISDIRVFNPNSMADRILGMGDVINLVKSAEEHISAEENKKLEKKLRESTFNYSDYLKQMKMMKNMGSMGNLMKMMPGMSGMGELEGADEELKKVEAMILSMTPAEREEDDELIHSRRKRISLGSGVTLDEVNRLIKGFKQAKQLFKNFSKLKGNVKEMFSMKDIKNQMGSNNLWH